MHKSGFTLVEVMVTVGLSLGLISLAILPLRLARDQPQPEASAFAAAFAAAHALAAANNGTGSGAVLVIADATNGTSVVRTLANRPLTGFAAPVAVSNIAPLTLPLPITIDNAATANFSIAISPSGELDIIKSTVSPGAAPVGKAPGCGSEGTPSITITVGTGANTATLQFACADGQLASGATTS